MTTPLRDFLSHYLSDPMSAGTMYYAAKVRLLKWRDRVGLRSMRDDWMDWVREAREPVISTRPVQLVIANAKLLQLKDAALIVVSGLLAVSLLANVGQAVVFQAQVAKVESRASETIAHERHLNALTLSALDDAIEKAETATMMAEAADTRAEKYKAMTGSLNELTGLLRAENERLKEQVIAGKIRVVNPDADAEALAATMIEAARTHGVPVDWILAIGEIESHFNPGAVSKAGARGVMQVMPRWGKYCPDLDTVAGNIHCATRILKYEARRHGSLNEGLAAYNGAQTSGQRERYTGKFWQALAEADDE